MNLNTKFKVGQKVYYYNNELESVIRDMVQDVERIATEKGQTTTYLFEHQYDENALQGCQSDLVSMDPKAIKPESVECLAPTDHDLYNDEVEFDDSGLGKLFCVTTTVGKVNLKLTSITMKSEMIIARFAAMGDDAPIGLGAIISSSRDAHNVFEMPDYDLGEKIHNKRNAVVLGISEYNEDEPTLAITEYADKLGADLAAMNFFS